MASADDVQALRQLTFLGLSASTNEASPPEDGEDGEDGDNNPLDARNLSEFLMEIGACSVSITDADADTDDEEPLFDEPSPTACANDPREGGDGAELSEEWAMVIPDWAAGVSAGEIIYVLSSSVGNFFPKSRGRQSCDAQAREQGAPLAGETGSLCVRGGRRKYRGGGCTAYEVLAEAVSTAEEVVAEAASTAEDEVVTQTADEVVTEAATTADEVVAEAAFTADEVVAGDAQTANKVLTKAESIVD